jgi:hypothetical protein
LVVRFDQQVITKDYSRLVFAGHSRPKNHTFQIGKSDLKNASIRKNRIVRWEESPNLFLVALIRILN